MDLCEEHLPDANYVCVVYSAFDRASFESAQHWLNLVLKSRKQTAQPLQGVAVATKEDLALGPGAQVDHEAATRWASQNGLEHFVVSCVPPSQSWEAPFRCIAEKFHAKYVDHVERAAGFAA